MGLNNLSGIAADVKFTPAAGGSNVCNVTLQVVDAYGKAINEVFNLEVFLSDAATGLGLTGTTASGTVTAKTSCGTVLGTLTAKKALRVQTLADGSFVLEITDSAKTAFYPCAVVPIGPNAGRITVGAVLTTALYG